MRYGAVVACLVGLANVSQAQPPTPSLEKQLQDVTERVIPQCLDAAARLEGWRKDYAAVAKTGAGLTALLKAKPALDADKALVKDWIGKVDGLVQGSETLKKLAGDSIARRVADAGVDAAPEMLVKIYEEEAMRGARAWAATWVAGVEDYIAKQFPEFKKLLGHAERLQARAQQVQAKAEATLEAAKAYHDQLTQAIQSLREPATLAKGFLENEVKAKYLNKPYKFGDVTVIVSQPDPTRSLFSPDAQIALQIQYDKLGFPLKANGLYFRYRKNQVPEPVFDKVKADTNPFQVLMSGALKALGDELPDFGGKLPFRIANPKFNDFTAKTNPGSIEFDVIIKLDKMLDFASENMPEMKGHCLVTTKGDIRLTNLEGGVTIPGTIPIGTSGLVFYTGKIYLKPKDKKDTITIGTCITPAPGTLETVYFDIQMSFGLQALTKGVSYKGQLKFGRAGMTMGTVDGVIARDKVTLNLDTASGASPMKVKFKGEMNKEGIVGKGTISALYGLQNMNAEFFVGFNGKGSFTVSEKYGLGGAVQAQVSLQGTYTPGFSKVEVRGGASLELNVDPLGSYGVALDVVGKLDPRPNLHARGSAAGFEFEFDAPTFDAIADEVRKSLEKSVDRFYDWIAAREKAAERYAAERGRALTNWVYKEATRLNLNSLAAPNLNRAIADGRKALQDLQRAFPGADLNDLGGEALDALNRGLDQLPRMPANVPTLHVPPVRIGGGVLGREGGSSPYFVAAVGGLPRGSSMLNVGRVGGHNNGFQMFDNHALESALAKGAKEQFNKTKAILDANRRFDKLLAEVGKLRIKKTKHARSGAVSELRVKFDRPVIHGHGTNELSMTFMVQAAGFKYDLDPRQVSALQTRSGSQAVIGEIRMAGASKGKPKVTVHVKAMNVPSAWNEDALIREALSDLVDKHFPGAAGRFDERMVAVHNHASEKITVWVQVEAKQGGGWKWLPGGVGDKASANAYHLGPNKTAILSQDGDTPLKGRRMRIWAESESGRLWLARKTSDVDLVGEKADNYVADAMQHFVYNFWTSKGPRELHERMIQVRNATDKVLTVSAQALSHDPKGGNEWDKTGKPVRLDPGKTVRLTQANGWYLRGKDVRITAQDDKAAIFKWTKHQKTPLHVVEGKGYSAETIGNFVIVLDERTASPSSPHQATLVPDEVMVPSVKGKTLQDAKAVLAKLGLKETHDAGLSPTAKVTAQTPETGWHSPQTTIKLTAIPDKFKLPDFKHLDLKAALDLGKKHGLDVKSKAGDVPTVPTKDKDLVGKTLVVKQTPLPGELVAKGAVVEITLAKFVQPAPAKVAVPDFKHLDLKAAHELAKKHGVEVKQTPGEVGTVTTKDKDLAGKTLVHQQKPPSGEMVVKGTAVEVTLAKFVAMTNPTPTKFKMPDLKNLELKVAQDTHKNLEIRQKQPATIKTVPTTDKMLAGKTVIATQSIARDEPVLRGMVVEVTLVRYVAAGK